MYSPTPHYHLEEEGREEMREEVGELLSGLITVTHSVFTITRGQYVETLTELSELVHVDSLRSTSLHHKQIMFAHSESNHPVLGITVRCSPPTWSS